MSEYENEYNNMLNAIKNGEEPFKRSEQVEKFHKELDKERFIMEDVYQKNMKKQENIREDTHFRSWSEGDSYDENLDDLYGKIR